MVQRLRVQFSRTEPLEYISHLDIIRLWERALRRAHIPLAYSEGFTPHPKISLAAPLSVGMTGRAELMDVVVTGQVSPHWFMTAVNQQLPEGMAVREVYPIPPTVPSLQSQVRFAEYEVEVATGLKAAEVEAAIDRLLQLESLPWQHLRDTGPRRYDLRPLIEDIWLVQSGGGVATLGMKLRCDSSGSGRPEQVTAALGFSQPPLAVRRTRLILEARRPEPRPRRAGARPPWRVR